MKKSKPVPRTIVKLKTIDQIIEDAKKRPPLTPEELQKKVELAKRLGLSIFTIPK